MPYCPNCGNYDYCTCPSTTVHIPFCEKEFINLVKALQEKDNKKKVELCLKKYIKCKKWNFATIQKPPKPYIENV